jgi:hypothetical protein
MPARSIVKKFEAGADSRGGRLRISPRNDAAHDERPHMRSHQGRKIGPRAHMWRDGVKHLLAHLWQLGAAGVGARNIRRRGKWHAGQRQSRD